MLTTLFSHDPQIHHPTAEERLVDATGNEYERFNHLGSELFLSPKINIIFSLQNGHEYETATRWARVVGLGTFALTSWMGRNQAADHRRGGRLLDAGRTSVTARKDRGNPIVSSDDLTSRPTVQVGPYNTPLYGTNFAAC